MKSVLEHVRRNVVGYIALFVALGGTGYAAVTLPQGSVGARQLKNHAIDPIKLSPKFINGNVRAWAVVTASGRVVGGGGEPEGGRPSHLACTTISWGVRAEAQLRDRRHDRFRPFAADRKHPSRRWLLDSNHGGVCRCAGFQWREGARQNNVTTVHTFNQAGQLTPLGFDLAVVC